MPLCLVLLGLLFGSTQLCFTQTPKLVGTFSVTENVSPVTSGSWAGTGSLPAVPIVLYLSQINGSSLFYSGGPLSNNQGNFSDLIQESLPPPWGIDYTCNITRNGSLDFVYLTVNLTNHTADAYFELFYDSSDVFPLDSPQNFTSSGLIDVDVGYLACTLDAYGNVQGVSLSGSTTKYQFWGGSFTTYTISGQLTPPLPSLRISSIHTPAIVSGQNTFISTDIITLQATNFPTTSGAPVKWTVIGLGAAAGIGGFPAGEVHNTDSSGTSTFAFIPNTNRVFFGNRTNQWTKGNRNPNPAIGFEVIAEWDYNSQMLQAKVSQSALGTLFQDETDTLRQEYVDYQITNVPDRSIVIPSLGAGFNQGNYNVQVSVNMLTVSNAIAVAYRGSSVTVSGKKVNIPQSATFLVSSGYRNPQRNKAVGSKYTGGQQVSKHVLGRALDLQPRYQPIWGVGLHNGLYQALYTAAKPQGTALAESNATPVSVGNASENHIHIQW